MTAMRVDIRPGDGVVARFGSYLLAVMGPVAPEAAAPLVGILRTAAGEGASGRTMVQRVAAYLVSTDSDPVFGVVAPDGDGWVGLVHGDAVLQAATPMGEVTLSGVGRPTWADGFLPADVEAIEIKAAVAPEPEASHAFDLVEGIVPGAGFAALIGETQREAVPQAEEVAEAAPEPEAEKEQPEAEPEAEPEPKAEPEQVDAEAEGEHEPEQEQPAELPHPDDDPAVLLIDLSTTEDVAPRVALSVSRPGERPEPVGESKVLVTGINCKRGHFNHPEAAFCSLCGISMLQQTQNPITGPRPPLGILVFGDGATVSVDDVYVIGREPTRDPAVTAGEARAFALDDPDQVLSRVHLAVTPNGWEVDVVDRGSANGTYVMRGDDWQRLEAGTPSTLESGMQVRLGNHQFVYEAHHRPRGAG